MSEATPKKRHHYVPKAYLRAFCDSGGKLRVYRKDEPARPLHMSPDNVAIERYYYSQPRPDGSTDHNTLEDLFSVQESKWPAIVARLQRREDVNDALQDIFMFLGLQRVRVPAARDAAEQILAESVMSATRVLDAAGKLPPKPPGHEDLLDQVVASIDPHQSIHAMVPMLLGMGQVLDRIGIGALHNETPLQFLTSDNPVLWFDPSEPESAMRPYVLRHDGPVVLIFPVSPKIVLYGHSETKAAFAQLGLKHGSTADPKAVQSINRQICQFAYQAVYARDSGCETLIQECASVSPVLKTHKLPLPRGGEAMFNEMAFGERKPKPKWDR